MAVSVHARLDSSAARTLDSPLRGRTGSLHRHEGDDAPGDSTSVPGDLRTFASPPYVSRVAARRWRPWRQLRHADLAGDLLEDSSSPVGAQHRRIPGIEHRWF